MGPDVEKYGGTEEKIAPAVKPMCYSTDSVIQHGIFLSAAAGRYMNAVDEFDRASIVSVPEDIESAAQVQIEAWDHLQMAIYEFNKRVEGL